MAKKQQYEHMAHKADMKRSDNKREDTQTQRRFLLNVFIFCLGEQKQNIAKHKLFL